MRDKLRPANTDDNLASQAFLYAGGELDETEEHSFEQRLAEDQAARDALCQAVELHNDLAGLAALAPPRAYRQKVRARLAQRPGVWSRIVGRRVYRGHPAVWASVGAAAAILLMFGWQPAQPPREPVQLAVTPTAALPQADRNQDTAEIATVWSELSNNEHLSRARDDQHRRRARSEDRRPLRTAQRVNRLLSPDRMN